MCLNSIDIQRVFIHSVVRIKMKKMHRTHIKNVTKKIFHLKTLPPKTLPSARILQIYIYIL